MRSIKRQIDGALGAHGAWLLEPYKDLSDTAGLILEPLAEIEEINVRQRRSGVVKRGCGNKCSSLQRKPCAMA